MVQLPSRDGVSRLPTSLSTFVGRGAESTHVTALLQRSRLFTITGPGGAGKSRLALHVADRSADRYPEGVRWVELADLADAALLAARVALSTGVHTDLGPDQRSELVARLADRPLLLVLDNCEHLAPHAADLVGEVLAGGAGIRVLATSRRPLGLEGEVVWSIPPLELPPADHGDRWATEEDLRRYASTRLFLDRARRARPSFLVDGDVATQVAHLCRHLDGLPLALELAAARVRSMEVRHIRAELGGALDLLSASRGRRASRHRTMQASIAWSERLLTRDERVVLRRSAVFAEGFTLEDALPVLSGADLGRHRVMQALDGLVSQSLLAFEDAPVAPARYRLLEVVRQYAERRLRHAGEEPALRRRHTEQYTARARELGTCLANGWDDRAFAWLTAEVGNLEAAVRMLCGQGSPARAAELLWHTQSVWGLVRPAVADLAIQQLLAHGDALDAGVRARLHVVRSVVLADSGATVAALGSAEEALPLARVAGDPVALARAGVYRAAIRTSADPVTAERELREAIAQCVQAGDASGAAFGRFWFGACLTVFQGATARGMRLVATQLEDHPSVAHPLHAAGAHCLMAEAHAERADLAAALDHARATDIQLDRVARLLRSGAARFRAMSVPGSVAALVRGYAAILGGEPPLPGTDLATSSVRSDADGYAVAAYLYRFLCGLDHLRRGEPEQALGDLTVAETLAARAGGWFTANTRIVGALAALSAGRPGTAGEWLERVDESELVAPMLRARLRVVQADLALHHGDPDTAEELAHLELESTAAEEITLEVAQLLEVLSRVAVAGDSHVDAVRLAGAAARLRRSRGLLLGPPGHLDPFHTALTVARGALGDRAFDEARREGEGLCMTAAVEYARRARGRRGRPVFGWGSLTPTERQVVELVVSGLTNPQIGARLLMSRETVKTHLRHVFGKLGLHNRAQLAAVAAQRGHAE